jgi:hypothetical protein
MNSFKWVRLTRTVFAQYPIRPRNPPAVHISLQSKFLLVVIGDDSGTISSYEYSKGKLNQEWKTSSLGKEISRIELAGPMNARDRIFYSGGTMLRGVRKGKDFWKLDTNLTETIKAFGIEDTNSIWTAGVQTNLCFKFLGLSPQRV